MTAVPLERLSWSVYCPFPGFRAVAEFSFGEKSWKTGARYPKLRGRSYSSSRYGQAMEVSTLDIGTDDYLVFKQVGDVVAGSGKVVMSYPHLRRFIDGLHEALEVAKDGCFRKGPSDRAYELTERGSGEAVITRIEDMFGGATIALQPVVLAPPRSGDEEEEVGGEPGMRMYLNGWESYSAVNLDEYATFVDFYDRFDLFATSRSAVQVAVTQTGGIFGAPAARTPHEQPIRKSPGSLGLSPKR